MRHLLTILSLAVLCGATATAAPVPDKGKPSSDEPPAQRIRKELNAPLTIEIDNQTLPQAINQLKDKSGIDFTLDRVALDAHFAERGEMGMDSVMVKAKLNKTPLRRGLRQILTEHELDYVIIGDQVLITTQQYANLRMMRQPVTLDIDKVPFADALKKLGRETATNLVVDGRATKEAQEKVSLQLEDVPLETAVRLLAEQAGLKAVTVDNVLYVTTKARATELKDDPDFKRKPDPGLGGLGMGDEGPGIGGPPRPRVIGGKGVNPGVAPPGTDNAGAAPEMR